MKLIFFLILSSILFQKIVFAVELQAKTQTQPLYKIDLQLAMDLAIQHSYDLKAAQASTNAAQETSNSAFRALGPNLSGQASALWKNNTLDKSAFNSTEKNLISTGTLTLTQPLFGMIPLIHTINQKNIALEINKNLEKATRNKAALIGAQYYLNLQLAMSGLSIAEANLTTLSKSKQDAESLFQTGSIYKDDYLRIILQFTQAEQSVITAKSNLSLAQFSLAQSLGISDVNQMQVIARDLSHWEKTSSLNVPDLEEAKEIALKQNPNVLASEENVKLAQATKTISQDNYIPSLDAVASVTRDFNSYNIRNNLSSENTLSYGFKLTWNIWDWGVRAAQNDALTEQIANEKYLSESEKESILNDVVSQYYNITNNLNALKTAKKSLATADEAFGLVSFRFLNGQVSALDLVTAQQNLTTSKADLAQARFNLDLAWLTFQTVLGKEPSL